MPIDARKYTNRLLERVDEGLLDPSSMLQNALCWMSEQDVKSFCIRYELEGLLFPETLSDDDEDEIDPTY